MINEAVEELFRKARDAAWRAGVMQSDWDVTEENVRYGRPVQGSPGAFQLFQMGLIDDASIPLPHAVTETTRVEAERRSLDAKFHREAFPDGY